MPQKAIRQRKICHLHYRKMVDGNRVDQLIVMDERKVDTMIQPDPEEVKTFDTSHVYGYMGICIMTMLALGILSKKRRHNV